MIFGTNQYLIVKEAIEFVNATRKRGQLLAVLFFKFLY